ncbi:MAG: ATP-binding cassette domain-containing protein [Ectothiorhodospiraceae bacterium]|nr:ATP-binding cassette domain-containing protein [Ectothiorhodospiraceae bacterium]
MLRIQQLSYRYPGGSVLRFPDWEVGQGEHWLLLGASGTGKTTLLQLLAGMLHPWHGHMTVAGHDLRDLRGRALDRFRGRTIGIIHQRLHLIPALTVTQNLKLARYLAGRSGDEAAIRKVLESLDMLGKQNDRPTRLSQGEAQRVALARALINGPDLVLADEPTAALDDDNCRRVARLLAEQTTACGATLIIATHDHRLREVFPRTQQLTADT